MDQKIRNIINSDNVIFLRKYFKKYPDDWNMLNIAMDTLGDSSLAIKDFEQKGIGESDGEKYLRFYGVMQAIFIQQDAIKHLFDVITKNFNEKLEREHNLTWNDDKLKSWNELRNYRNLIVGHPIECGSFVRGEVKRTSISRIELESDSFEIIIYDSNGETKTNFINIKKLLIAYGEEARILIIDLEKFIEKIKKYLDSSKMF